MISEGPSLVENLPTALHDALQASLRPGEELEIAVPGNTREALAATPGRMLLIKEPIISGSGPVEVREVTLRCLSRISSEARPTGGRISWETAEPGAPLQFDFPAYDGAKFGRVARKLEKLVAAAPASAGAEPAAPAAAPPAAALTGARDGVSEETPVAASLTPGAPCPHCGAAVPADGAWCPACGQQTAEPCWECGRPLAGGARFCASCGTPNTELAVVTCRECGSPVARGHVYCTGCGAQSRLACAECERPLRREWRKCPYCGGDPEWEGEGVGEEPARLHGEPDDPSAWLRAAPDPEGERLNAGGAEAYERGDYDEAARLFREATEADPDNASYYTNLGVAFGELNDDVRAFEAYRKAVELNPKEISAFLNMGYLYNERERASEAREMWETVVRLAPDSEEAREARENLDSLEEV